MDTHVCTIYLLCQSHQELYIFVLNQVNALLEIHYIPTWLCIKLHENIYMWHKAYFWYCFIRFITRDVIIDWWLIQEKCILKWFSYTSASTNLATWTKITIYRQNCYTIILKHISCLITKNYEFLTLGQAGQLIICCWQIGFRYLSWFFWSIAIHWNIDLLCTYLYSSNESIKTGYNLASPFVCRPCIA